MRIWHGVVKADGDSQSTGSGGWTSKRAGDGKYEVFFEDKPAGAPSVVACQYTDTNDRCLSVMNITERSFLVSIVRATDGKYKDLPFSFIAVSA